MLRDETSGVEATWCGVENDAGYDEQCVRLHRTLKRIVKARGALDAQEAEALREAERLRLWRHYGFSSLLEYMEMEMGYSPRAAIERLRVAKAIVELPEIADAMAQGDLSFSAGRELTRVVTPETEGEWLEAIAEKNQRQVEQLVSGRKRGDKPTDPADPSLRKRTLRYEDIAEETAVLLRQAREILEREYGERLTDDAFLRMFGRMVIDGPAVGNTAPDRTRAPYQIGVTICAQCKRGWQHGGGAVTEMSPPALEVALCDAVHIGSVDGEVGCDGPWTGVDDVGDDDAVECAVAGDAKRPATVQRGSGDAVVGGAVTGDAKRPATVHRASGDAIVGGAVTGDAKRPATVHRAGGDAVVGGAVADDTERATTANSPLSAETTRAKRRGTRARSDIPPALRRKVRHRDQGKCRVPWCRSARNCDQHHMVALATGGTHTEENLITLCESHHLAHHAGALMIEGTASTATFKNRAHNSFAIVERVVETQSALKGLGFDKQEVKAAMEKTRAHVGTSELTLEQWIAIALRYCPRPVAR